MESVIISSEKVIPSSPTPRQLQTYNLSMLDQVIPPMLVPIVLYYFPSTHNIHEEISNTNYYHDHELLKSSLSEILTRFYPLAGKIKEDGLSIDCNDDGVPFVVAKIKGQKLSDLLRNPNPKVLCGLVPCEIKWDSELGPGDNVAMIKVNYFDCGGMAIATVLWHKMADAVTIGNFLNSWAATARGSIKDAACPNYIFQSLFPPKQEVQTKHDSLQSILKIGKSVMRRYVFDGTAISKLREDRTIKVDGKNPTRVELVSALIWKCFMAASIANGKSSVSLLTHAVNLRRRAEPPFPSDCFGNFGAMAAAITHLKNEVEEDVGALVRKLRDAITKIDGDYVKRMQGDEGFSGYTENLRRIWGEIPDELEYISMSSWCNFGFYSIDFGWGKPIWIERCDAGSDGKESPFLNVVWMMDTRNGDGIEAWITLDENYMKVFDNIEDLKNVASIDPSPLENYQLNN